eukprot:1161228-Pelagomonas_calceolata.AAC.2
MAFDALRKEAQLPNASMVDEVRMPLYPVPHAAQIPGPFLKLGTVIQALDAGPVLQCSCNNTSPPTQPGLKKTSNSHALSCLPTYLDPSSDSHAPTPGRRVQRMSVSSNSCPSSRPGPRSSTIACPPMQPVL